MSCGVATPEVEPRCSTALLMVVSWGWLAKRRTVALPAHQFRPPAVDSAFALCSPSRLVQVSRQLTERALPLVGQWVPFGDEVAMTATKSSTRSKITVNLGFCFMQWGWNKLRLRMGLRMGMGSLNWISWGFDYSLNINGNWVLFTQNSQKKG